MKKFLLLTLALLAMLFVVVGCGPTEPEESSTECPHTNTRWVETGNNASAPTCTEDGSRYKQCEDCWKKLETEVLPATGHTYDADNKCTCGSIQIVDAASLKAFGESITYNKDYQWKTVTLTADIDMTGETWTVPSGAFAGTFEGNGHTISNLKIQPTSYIQYVGFFSQNEGKINNLTLTNVELRYTVSDAPIGVGCLAGGNTGKIENCHVDGMIAVSVGGYSASISIGGLVGDGDGYSGTLVNRSSAKVNITGNAYKQKGNSTFGIFAGGLMGKSGGTVSNCYATGNVAIGAEHFARAAGLIAMASGNVENCYATGNSSASIKTYGSSSYPCLSGALFGSYGNSGSEEGTVKNCFATGNASASYAHALVPMITDEVVNCYYAEGTAVGGSSISGATEAGTAIALDTIKTASFAETLTWDAEVWTFTDGEYPTLK